MSSSVRAAEIASGGSADSDLADPAAKPMRRSFTAEYRARVIAEYDAAPHGEKSGVLRREGLYQSQVREWRAQRDAVAAGLLPERNSHKGSKFSRKPARSEAEELRADNARLTRELAKSAAVVEIMGKLQGLLDGISESTDTPPSSTTR